MSGNFDFHGVTVSNTSVTADVPEEEGVAVVTGLAAYSCEGSECVATCFLRLQACVDHYEVDLETESGEPYGLKMDIFRYIGEYTIVHTHADVEGVSSSVQYTTTVSATSSTIISPGVSRMINANESVPGAPSGLKGHPVGSNGILLSWTMPPDTSDIDGYIIRYKEVCPYPDPVFTQVTKYLDVPETLLTDFTSGSTYHIQVAGSSPAGMGPFSKPVYTKTNESPPGLVTNLTAFAQNHTSVLVKWFLPHRINGLITKFSVKAKHARTGQTVRNLEVNAEDIMMGALPHCNDAAEILSRATVSPLEMTAVSPPYTLGAVPSAAAWSVPISVGVDQLRPYTAYLFEVSAFTSDGEGQIASTMVRMPESVPEDAPQNLSVLNVTSRSISLAWNSPNIITGKFTYVVFLYGPSGYLYENSTADMRFSLTGLAPYAKYSVEVGAKAAGDVGPVARNDVRTSAEAPSAVQDLVAFAEDAVSVRVNWRTPAQPNGPITHYRLQVLLNDTLLQDITLVGELNANTTGSYEDESPSPDQNGRRRRNVELGQTSTAAHIDPTQSTDITSFSLTHLRSAEQNTDAQTDQNFNPSVALVVTETPSDTYHSFQPPTIAFSATPVPPVTLPPWLRTPDDDVTAESSRLANTPGTLRLSTRQGSITAHAVASASSGVSVREEMMDLSTDELYYLVSDLEPFTEYTFRVAASTIVGEGPAADITEKTREQVPSSVLELSYQNISSTSIFVSWAAPLNPNGRITHYTVYGLALNTDQRLKWVTNSTSILITDLEKYTGYMLHVAASTAVGESLLSQEDGILVLTLEDEPDSPPVNLTVVDTSSSTATLTWSAPEKANGVIQQYTILYENRSFSDSVNTSSNKVTLTHLRPFTYYNVSVMAFTRFGHGNQASDYLLVLSGEDVPGSPPYSLAYESLSPNEVNVTWLPPLVPNGIITHYSLELWNSTHYLNLTSPTNFLHLTHLRKFARYRVTVQAHTRAGPGNFSTEPLNITTLEDAPDTPPQFLHARKLSNSEVELSWQPPLETNSEILYYVVRVWNETMDLLQNATETSVIINMDLESLYNASVSSWTRLGDGGMRAYIIFDAEPLEPPQNVNFANITTSAVTLLWYPPTEPNGIVIVHYTIYYTHNNTVAKQEVPVSDLNVPVSPDTLLSWTLTGLIGGTNYTVWMTSSTVLGDGGVWSEPLTLLLPEDVPSDSVHNLTAQIFSSTAIIVSWDPPLEPNGRPHYILTLQEAGVIPVIPNQAPPVVNKTITRTTTDNVFLFTKLRKYFPYVLTVTPATGAGPAHNHTSTTYLRTDDDVPSSAPLLVSAANLSSSSIAVAWQRPLEANGEITEYIITLFGPGGSNIMQTPESSFTLSNLLPYTAYNLSITAATRKGSGPALVLMLHTDEGGPVSPPRNLTIFNHTAVSVWLSWEPPLEPNGVVLQYGFRIRELITHTVTHRNSSGPSTTEYISGFRPHRSYEISVYSYTRVGHGNQFSSPVTFTTNESVSEAVGNLSCSGVRWDSIQLLWDPPLNPNGQILFYEIVMELDSYQVNAAEFTVTGLPPDQEYILGVAAVNSAGSGEPINCTASTLSESAPSAPRFLAVSQVTANNVTLKWAPPLSIPGLLKEYRLVTELLDTKCEPDGLIPAEEPASDCLESSVTVLVNASEAAPGFTLHPLAKYRHYRFKVAAVTNAGVGEYTEWIYVQTLAGNPDAPPRDIRILPTSGSFRIDWDPPDIISGPTSYLVQVGGPGLNYSIIRAPGELTTVVVTNLTAFSLYSVMVTAFTGPVENAAEDGKAIGPFVFQTLEEEPKDPPKNVVVSIIPDEVNQVKVTFTPPEEPNGRITSYFVYVYEKELLVRNVSLNTTQNDDDMLTAVIDGLKGGHDYSIQISAKNGAGRSPPSPHVQITTGIKAPAKPAQRPQAALGHRGVAMVTHKSITIRMPACFYSDDNGPIAKIQVIVAESGVKDAANLTTWRNAFFKHPGPYVTDQGFPNPPCPGDTRGVPESLRRNRTMAETYVIGERDECMQENHTDPLCNGPLKANTVYVFKFRATNSIGQFTDSQYSDHIKTAAYGLLSRDEQIILGVLLSFFLAMLLIVIICVSVKIHQRKKEGGTYSPREAEIIETKCKLDQLIAVADLELKQEKVKRYSSFFFRRKEIYVIQLLSYRKSLKPVNKKSFLQHVEDLCNNDNAKFQEEFSELPKLLQDLATTDADLPWNKSKNRFPNIKPYNNSRVKLLSEPGTAGSDYINASFVSGYLCPNEFIATQGPLPNTVADFWKMIWETGTRAIAMLTRCHEKGRIRCHKYWPEDNKPMSVFGDILISKVSEEILPDWTVRTLKVEKHGHYILVRHFNYTSWPEHGVPECCGTLIKFVQAVRGHRHENTTIAVHCSAGVGRTGVFIALDHLIQHIRDHDFVDVYGLVAELRSERMCMVQNLAQYIFLHQSTLELLNNKGNSQSIWFVSYSALEKLDSLDAMEGDVELEWEETTM
ncbi:phosphatidylinositol phosphatase PTPRQ [Syngnathus acus]|uniref:phosphatidylinositol phosphatase PTPRQ n=1 Tax=Syngnathus acus TaxID=161584 RepID=UPI001885AC5C|nr:phosphatidylinositol phosphatase PTPRQ [Syngnathus acus]